MAVKILKNLDLQLQKMDAYLLTIIFKSMLFKRFWRVNEVGRAINDDNVVCFSTVVFDELPSFGVVEFGASACADESGWRLTLDI